MEEPSRAVLGRKKIKKIIFDSEEDDEEAEAGPESIDGENAMNGDVNTKSGNGSTLGVDVGDASESSSESEISSESESESSYGSDFPHSHNSHPPPEKVEVDIVEEDIIEDEDPSYEVPRLANVLLCFPPIFPSVDFEFGSKFQHQQEGYDEPSSIEEEDDDYFDEEPSIPKKKKTRGAQNSMKVIQLGLRERRRVNYAEEEANEDSDSEFEGAEEEEEEEQVAPRSNLPQSRARSRAQNPTSRRTGALEQQSSLLATHPWLIASVLLLSFSGEDSALSDTVPTRFSARQERKRQLNYSVCFAQLETSKV